MRLLSCEGVTRGACTTDSDWLLSCQRHDNNVLLSNNLLEQKRDDLEVHTRRLLPACISAQASTCLLQGGNDIMG